MSARIAHTATYSGEYTGKIDSKGRLLLPSRIKARFSSYEDTDTPEVILNLGVEPCVVLYSTAKYQDMCGRYEQLDEFDPEHRKLLRSFYKNIIAAPLDSMGRILIPKRMLLHANLDKACSVVGVGDYVELWNPETMESHLIDQETHASVLKKSMTEAQTSKSARESTRESI